VLKILKLLAIIFVLVLSTASFDRTANAATGYQGFTVSRDGVPGGLNITWHNAIMGDPYSTTAVPVIQAPGGEANVRWDTWSGFIAGNNNFTGVYRPKTSPTSYDRDLFVSMGSNLITESIPYTVIEQIFYDSVTAGVWVDPSEIVYLRCDGVVEYIYEWYGFRVYGNDAYWDITRANYDILDHHSWANITPQAQAQSYLTRITTIMWPQVNYSYGSTGSNVALIQSQLTICGFYPGSADGIFGSKTKSAVINFQNSRGLTADGIVGFNTWNALFQ